MLENNEEFKTAFEELAEQLRQEKDNNQVLMSMQEQLLANLQESYEDGEEMEDEGEGEEEDGGETPVAELEDATVPGVCDTPRPVRSPPRGAA